MCGVRRPVVTSHSDVSPPGALNLRLEIQVDTEIVSRHVLEPFQSKEDITRLVHSCNYHTDFVKVNIYFSGQHLKGFFLKTPAAKHVFGTSIHSYMI